MDTFSIASLISGWNVTIPKPLKEAIHLFDECGFVHYDPVFPTDITAKNLSGLVTEYATQLAVQDKFLEATNHVRTALAGRLLRIAGECAPDIRDAELPKFNEAVTTFKENVGLLPESLDSASLIRSGGDSVNAFHRAAEAATTIKKYSDWLFTVSALPQYVGCGDSVPVLRVTRPTTRKQYSDMLNIRSTDCGIPDDLLYAARNDIQFAMNLPDEAADLKTGLDNQPIVPVNKRMVTW